MNSILIVDCETTGLDPATDAVLEIGAVRWSVEHRTILECWSTLLAHDPPRENSAELVNRIPSAALKKAMPARAAMLSLQDMAVECDAVVAHNADFDASFLPVLKGSRWICSMNDIEWPWSMPGASLINVALAHDVAVSSAHRALTDCQLLARLFERVSERNDIDSMLARALRPKALVQAVVSYDDREKAKAAGFRWDAEKRQWLRKMAVDDVAALPFETRRVA